MGEVTVELSGLAACSGGSFNQISLGSQTPMTARDLETFHPSIAGCYAHQMQVGELLPDVSSEETILQREDSSRCCWICQMRNRDDWIRPCNCRGDLQWVHESCLFKWLDFVQNANQYMPLSCHWCHARYLIVTPKMNKFATILEICDKVIDNASPFVVASILCHSLYWTSWYFGAVTIAQTMGVGQLLLIENCHPIVVFVGLPTITVGLILLRMVPWHEVVLSIIYKRPHVDESDPTWDYINPPEESAQYAANESGDLHNATRVVCGAFMFPAISSIMGMLLFSSMEHPFYRTLLGGTTYLAIKAVLKIYLKIQQRIRKRKGRVVDYTEENVRIYVN